MDEDRVMGAGAVRVPERLATTEVDPAERLLDQVPAACFRTDPNGNCTFVNRQWVELTGMDLDEAAGTGWHRIIHPDDRDRVVREGLDIERRGKAVTLEFRLNEPGRPTTWLSGTSGPILDERGEIQGYVGWLTDISERIELQQAQERALMEQIRIADRLRREEERFRLIVENTSEGIWRLDACGDTVFANARMAEMLGCAPADLLGRPARAVLGAEVGGDVVAQLLGSTGEERVLQEVVLTHADGSQVPVMLAAAPISGIGAVSDGSLVIVTDLGGLRRAEAMLHAAEHQFEQVFARAPLGISITGLDTRILKCNQAFSDLTGYSIAELKGRRAYTLLIPEDWDETNREIPRLLTEPESHVRVDHRILRSDGQVSWAQTDTSVVLDNDGTPLYYVVLTADISERKRIEEQLAHEASHDALTGLPNRTEIGQLIEQAQARAARRDSTLALMFVDLDRFKEVNDSLGHAAGDQVLVEAANRLRNAVRLGDTVARYGGDEFVVLCEDINGADGAEAVAERIGLAFTTAFMVGDQPVHVGVSVGVTVTDGCEARAELLRLADVALYRAKASRRR